MGVKAKKVRLPDLSADIIGFIIPNEGGIQDSFPDNTLWRKKKSV